LSLQEQPHKDHDMVVFDIPWVNSFTDEGRALHMSLVSLEGMAVVVVQTTPEYTLAWRCKCPFFQYKRLLAQETIKPLAGCWADPTRAWYSTPPHLEVTKENRVE
jgi:hypothetical protein